MTPASSSFPPINTYAFLSDTHTAALLGPDGAVEWFCVPRFDGDAVFARLLDRRASVFSVTAAGAAEPSRRYLPETLVLESRYSAPDGVLVGYDFLAVRRGTEDRPIRAEHLLVRRLSVERGRVRLIVRVDARPGYGRQVAGWEQADGGWRARGGPLRLRSALTFATDGTALHAEVELLEGQSLDILLDYGNGVAERDGVPDRGGTPPADDGAELLARTCHTWREWSARSDYTGFGQEAVRHSALVLRGLSLDETGALIAAPTTSLPEEIGGVRNWDYRYTWHRDAALLLLALFRLGHAEEGRRYLRFLLDTCACATDVLAPMVGPRGAIEPEHELAHLSGYAGSRPVRVGNRAADQIQFDTYGHVLDAALAYQRLTGELTGPQWAVLRRHVDTMADRWPEPDHGVWEIRGPRRHYVNSKVMAWVCLDRGVRLAELLGDDEATTRRWRQARDELHADVLRHGYDPDVGSFVLAYGSTEPDASLLRIPLVGFLPGDDPRVLGTIDRVRRTLEIGPALVRRYEADDGLPGVEGAFLLCSFELVSALVLAGRREEARRVFAQLCRHGGPLGLYPEQLSADGTALGNHPQAFTHLALIEAALNLEDAGDRDALHAWAERTGRSDAVTGRFPARRPG